MGKVVILNSKTREQAVAGVGDVVWRLAIGTYRIHSIKLASTDLFAWRFMAPRGIFQFPQEPDAGLLTIEADCIVGTDGGPGDQSFLGYGRYIDIRLDTGQLHINFQTINANTRYEIDIEIERIG